MQAFYELSRDNYPSLAYFNKDSNFCAPHFHQQVEIIYIDSGTVPVTINNNAMVLQKGQIAVSDSFDVHSYTDSEGGLSSVMIIPHSYLGAYQNAKRGRVLSGNFITDPDCADQIYKIMQLIVQKQQSGQLIIGGLISALLGIISETLGFSDKPHTSDLELLRRVLIYIDDNYAGNLTLNVLAAHFGYSHYYFSRLIKKYLNCTLSEYIISVRLNKAAAKLKDNPGAKLTDIALSSGFNSLQTFHRCFKNKYGISPMSYILTNNH